jgi:hypothetical protein
VVVQRPLIFKFTCAVLPPTGDSNTV